MKNKQIIIITSLLCFWLIQIAGQNKSYAIEGEIPIWPGVAPGSDTLTIVEKITGTAGGSCNGNRTIEKVTVPTILPFVPDTPNGTAIIIWGGGSSNKIVYDKEGTDIALWFKKLGVTAFVIKYRLPVDDHINKQYILLQDAQRAIRYIKKNAAKWKIDTAKIGVIGFSAGGYPVAFIATRFNKRVYAPVDIIDSISARPYFMILAYGIVSLETSIAQYSLTRNYIIGSSPTQEAIDEFSNEKHVTSATPPTFLAHAIDDASVNPDNARWFYKALIDAGVSASLHIYKNGGHGKAICSAPGYDFAKWTEDCKIWMDSMKLITYTPPLVIKGMNNKLSQQFQVYPNPTTGVFSIQSEGAITQICIYNMLGKRVYHYLLKSCSATIDIGQLPKGFYVLKVQEKNTEKVMRIEKR